MRMSTKMRSSGCSATANASNPFSARKTSQPACCRKISALRRMVLLSSTTITRAPASSEFLILSPLVRRLLSAGSPQVRRAWGPGLRGDIRDCPRTPGDFPEGNKENDPRGAIQRGSSKPLRELPDAPQRAHLVVETLAQAGIPAGLERAAVPVEARLGAELPHALVHH